MAAFTPDVSGITWFKRYITKLPIGNTSFEVEHYGGTRANTFRRQGDWKNQRRTLLTRSIYAITNVSAWIHDATRFKRLPHIFGVQQHDGTSVDISEARVTGISNMAAIGDEQISNQISSCKIESVYLKIQMTEPKSWINSQFFQIRSNPQTLKSQILLQI